MTIERGETPDVPPAWRTPLLGALSGALFALAFPPLEWLLLLPLAPLPWLVALGRERRRGVALLSGFLFGLAHWCVAIPWIVYVVTRYGGQSTLMGVLCLVILAAILAEWPAIVGWGVVAAAPPESGWRLAAFPILWAASEHLRTFVYGGFPWNLTGHALYRRPVWMQSASVWGVIGLGGLVAGVTALLARAILRRRLLPAAAAAILVAGVGIWGAVRFGRPSPSGPELSVALLQPNVNEEARRTAEGAAAGYREVVAQAREATEARPALIVIPESAFPVYWDRSPTLRQDLATIAHGGPMILFNDVLEEPDGRYYNVARLLTPAGLAASSYRKVHLVPFGEYVPLPSVFFFVRQVSTEIGAFSAADRPAVLPAGPFALGIGVCYEILYPALARAEVADGANLLVTISNDSWYGRAGAQEQHFAGAVLRAVETHRALLRAAITGISGIVDADGRIAAETRPDERTIAAGSVRLSVDRTAWVRWGFWIPRIVDVAAGVLLLLGAARLIRHPRAES